MLNHRPIIVEQPVRPEPPPCDEYCTVVFRLQDGRSAMGWLLAELAQNFEGSGIAEVVKFEIGDHLRSPR